MSGMGWVRLNAAQQVSAARGEAGQGEERAPMDQAIKAAAEKAVDAKEGEKTSREDVVKMMIKGMGVHLYPDAALRTVCETVKPDEFDDSLKMFVEAMSTVMLQHRGIGISAPQVGVNIRVLVVNLTRKNEDNIAIINPRIVEASEEMVEAKEGCLSFPGVEVKVKRPATITIEAESFEGKTITLDLKGLGARVVQHEMDHLDGKLLIDNVTGLKRDMIVRKMKKIIRHAKNQNKPPKAKRRRGRKKG
jgi:peptide deformylase